MKVKYDVEIPKRKNVPERKVLEEFISSTHDNMALEYDSYDEAKKRRGVIRTMCKRENWSIGMSLPSDSNVLYILKKGRD